MHLERSPLEECLVDWVELDWEGLKPVPHKTTTPPSPRGTAIYSYSVVRVEQNLPERLWVEGMEDHWWDLAWDAHEIQNLGEILPRIVFGEQVGGIGVGLKTLPTGKEWVQVAVFLLQRSIAQIADLGWSKTEITSIEVDFSDRRNPVVRVSEVRK